MSIWKYNKRNSLVAKEIIQTSQCIFCNSLMKDRSQKRGNKYYHWDRRDDLLKICPTCGWWQFKSWVYSVSRSNSLYREFGGIGTLKELDLNNIEIPLKEVRTFLLAKYKSRYSMNPQLFEETVGSVFKGIGYRSEVTSFHNDGGIDVILRNSKNDRIGVQVKRYKNRINVSQIREFTGALLLNGYNKGIFVTTGAYQSGAYKMSDKAQERGIKIELLNGTQFFDALKLSQIGIYRDFDEWYKEFGYLSIYDFQQLNGE